MTDLPTLLRKALPHNGPTSANGMLYSFAFLEQKTFSLFLIVEAALAMARSADEWLINTEVGVGVVLIGPGQEF
jgi:hypothetical protein